MKWMRMKRMIIEKLMKKIKKKLWCKNLFSKILNLKIIDT